MSIKAARRGVTQATAEKRAIVKQAAEHRLKWLERMAQDVAEKQPNCKWETVLKQMVSAAKQQVQNKKLSAILKPDWSSLDYIEVPNEKWFLSKDGTELTNLMRASSLHTIKLRTEPLNHTE
jgi:hypothetical protein